jgi:hypothetical protein
MHILSWALLTALILATVMYFLMLRRVSPGRPRQLVRIAGVLCICLLITVFFLSLMVNIHLFP